MSNPTLYISTCTNSTAASFDTIIQGFVGTSSSCASVPPVCYASLTADGSGTGANCDTLQLPTNSSLFYWVRSPSVFCFFLMLITFIQIYVTGYNGAVGNFAIKVASTPFRTNFFGALAITSSASSSSVLVNTQVYPECGALPAAQWGRWFSYSGLGQLTYSVCPIVTSGDPGADARLTVFRPSTGGCTNDACYSCDTPIDSQASSCETGTINSNGAVVYVFVSHVLPTKNLTFSYSFSTINAPGSGTAVPPSLSSTCTSGATLALGAAIRGSLTTSGTSGYSASVCGLTSASTRGAWYQFTGVSGQVYLHTCSSYTSFDTSVRVFASSAGASCSTCGCMSCMGYNDDRSTIYSSSTCTSLRSVYALVANPSTTYYVFVGAISTSTTSGNFELSLTSNSPGSSQTTPSLTGFDTPFVEEVTRNVSSAVIIGAALGGVFGFIILVAIIVGICVAMRRRSPAYRTSAVVVQQQPSVVVTQQPQYVTTTTTQPMYTNSVQMQPMYDPNMAGSPQHPPGYYT